MPATDALRIGDLFTNAARAVPDRVAVWAGARSLTFAEIDETSNRIAASLVPLGITRGARVALWSGTDIDAVPMFAALSKTGALFIPVNGLLGADEAMGIIGRSRPDLLVTDVGRPVPEGAPTTLALDEILDASARYPATPFDAGPVTGRDPHVAFFTSGSTGLPKGAVLSHAANYLRSHPGALPEPRGAMVCPYPLFHMGAWTIALQQWQARDAVILPESTGADAICAAVERHRATRLNCIPALWQRIIDEVDGAPRNPLASLRFADTGTSETRVELLTAIERIVPNAHLRVFYGSTEAGSVACLDHADFRRKPGSCGPPAPGVTVRRAADGELWVTGALLFDGYLDDPGATDAALVDGWYRTGDVVDEDADGFLRIVGRTGDVIRTGGEAVAPAEVEAVLAGLPSIADVAVVGLPDPTWGEVVCAVVVPAPGHPTPTLVDIRGACAGRVASFKVPRRIELVDGLPRTASTGQVQRRLVVEQVAGR